MFWQINNYNCGQNIKKPSESTKEQSKASRNWSGEDAWKKGAALSFLSSLQAAATGQLMKFRKKTPNLLVDKLGDRWARKWGMSQRGGAPTLCINCPNSCKPLNYACVRQTPCNQLRLNVSAAAHPEETESKLRKIHHQLKQFISNGWNLSYTNHTSGKSSPLHQGGKIKMLLDKRKLRESVVIQPPLHVLEGEEKLYQMEAQISEKHVSKHKNIFSS